MGNSTPCLEWDGATNSQGYGVVSMDGKLQYVHRLTWMNDNGTIPSGMVVMHSCDNRRCFALAHLSLGTQRQNLRDSVVRGRNPNSKKTHCPAGHEYSKENTYRYPGVRRCKTCQRDREVRSNR